MKKLLVDLCGKCNLVLSIIMLTIISCREWTEYAINLAKQLGLKGIQKEEKLGKNLNVEAIDSFKAEQVVQLHELYLASKGKEEEDEKKN